MNGAGQVGLKSDPVASALADLRRGRMVVLSNQGGPEAGGSLVLAAEHVTAAAINFMASEAHGLICLVLTGERCDQLGLQSISRPGESRPPRHDFAVSIEARDGTSTGISAQDRARTIQVAIDPGCDADDLVRPGHMFPIRSRPGGILERPARSEAAVELAGLAGKIPAAVVCEILDDSGAVAAEADLHEYAASRGLPLVTIAELLDRRRLTEGSERVGPAGSRDDPAVGRVFGQFPTGGVVVTARDGEGRPVGTHVGTISSVSHDPPLLLLCLARESATLAAARETERFAVNVLARGSRSSEFTGDPDGAEGLGSNASEIPVPPDALATIACRVDAIHAAGDQAIVVGEALPAAGSERGASPSPAAGPYVSYVSLGAAVEASLRAVG